MWRQGRRQKEMFPEFFFVGESSVISEMVICSGFIFLRKRKNHKKSHFSRNLKSSSDFGGGKPSAMSTAF